tara:strand:+ start:6642 stop:7463 length:822 start_codon:yes stop_codon:yes gene_type:complete
MNKEYNIKESLNSGDIGVNLIQFIQACKGNETSLATKEQDRYNKIDMFINKQASQVKTDYQSKSTGHSALELAEINFDRKKEQFGGMRAGSMGVMCEHCEKQIIKSQPQSNVTAGAVLQQDLLDNCVTFVYIMLGVGIAVWRPKDLNTAMWHWLRNHTDRDKKNNATWTIIPARNPSYISLNLLIPYEYLQKETEVIIKKGWGKEPTESYRVGPLSYMPWAEVQNMILGTQNEYWQPLMHSINEYLDNQYNTKASKQVLEEAMGIQLLHNPIN